jgi:glycosyltransferase involved in cell wall biosynthesis
MNYLETNFLSVVIVARNENNMIESQLNMLFREIKKHFKNFEIIVVDNASNDGTSEILKNYSEKMTIIELPFCHSEGMALAAGVDIAIGDYIVEIPYIDGTLDISLIYKMYEKLIGGVQILFSACQKRRHGVQKYFIGLLIRLSDYRLGNVRRLL